MMPLVEQVCGCETPRNSWLCRRSSSDQLRLAFLVPATWRHDVLSAHEHCADFCTVALPHLAVS